MKCVPPKHTRPLAGPAGQLDSQIFPRSPAYLLNPATANKPFLAPKRLKPAFFINRQALPTIAEVMQALLVFSKHVHYSRHQRKQTTMHNQRSLNFWYWKKCQFCLLCNPYEVHDDQEGQTQMLSWLALYHPLILGAFIPHSPKLGPLDCLCAQALLQNMLFSKSSMCFVQACFK